MNKKTTLNIGIIAVIYLISIFIFSHIYHYYYIDYNDNFYIASDLKTQLEKENKSLDKKELLDIGKTMPILKKNLYSDSLYLLILNNFFEDSAKLQTTSNDDINKMLVVINDDDEIELGWNTLYSSSMNFYNPTYKHKQYTYKLRITDDKMPKGAIRHRQIRVLCSLLVKNNNNDSTMLKLNYLLLLNVYKNRQFYHYEDIHNMIIKGLSQQLIYHRIKGKRDLFTNDSTKSILSARLLKEDKSLKYIDFLYFSVITQSSTGYGDILPNSRTIRLIVILQVLISVLLVTFVLTIITSALGEKSSKK